MKKQDQTPHLSFSSISTLDSPVGGWSGFRGRGSVSSAKSDWNERRKNLPTELQTALDPDNIRMTDFCGSGLQVHPVSRFFPLMGTKAQAALREDIKANGQTEPILRLGDVLLDGRNRLRACAQLGKKPNFAEFTGPPESAAAHILGANLHRRHLSVEQRAVVQALAIDWQERREAAKEKLAQAGGSAKPHVSSEITSGPKRTGDSEHPSRDEIQKATGVSRRVAQDAINIAKHPDSETAAAVIAGTLDFEEAAAQAKVKAKPQPKRKASGQSRRKPQQKSVTPRTLEEFREDLEWLHRTGPGVAKKLCRYFLRYLDGKMPRERLAEEMEKI